MTAAKTIPVSEMTNQGAQAQYNSAIRNIFSAKGMLDKIRARQERNPEHEAFQQLPAAEEQYQAARQLKAEARKAAERLKAAHDSNEPMPADEQHRLEVKTKQAQTTARRARTAIDDIYKATMPPSKEGAE